MNNTGFSQNDDQAEISAETIFARTGLAALQLEIVGSRRARKSAIRNLMLRRSTGMDPLVARDGLFRTRCIADDMSSVDLRILTLRDGSIDSRVLDRVDSLVGTLGDLAEVEAHVVLDGTDRIWSAFYLQGVLSDRWSDDEHFLEDVVIDVTPPHTLFRIESDDIGVIDADPRMFAPRELTREVKDGTPSVWYRMRLRDQWYGHVAAVVEAHPHLQINARVLSRRTGEVSCRGTFFGSETLQEWMFDEAEASQ